METSTLYFGAFTGATTVLRDTTCATCSKYIFNVRAGYAQEARATMELFKKRGVTDYTRLVSFNQNSYGDAGYKGLVQAYIDVVGAYPVNANPTTQSRVSATRVTTTPRAAQAAAAEAYIADILENSTGTINIGVMMTDTYGAGGDFITALRRRCANDSQQTSLMKATRLKLYFSNVSFVGPNALSDKLVAGHGAEQHNPVHAGCRRVAGGAELPSDIRATS